MPRKRCSLTIRCAVSSSGCMRAVSCLNLAGGSMERGCLRSVAVEVSVRGFCWNGLEQPESTPSIWTLDRFGARSSGWQVTCAAASSLRCDRLPFPDECFDAIFDYGVLHHVPIWQTAVAEIRRVIKPGARFFFEEVTREALNRCLYRTFLKHPAANRFNEVEFVAELAASEIELLAAPRRLSAIGIFIGVGERRRNDRS